MYRKGKIIALIPARGGSKRVKNKNIKLLGGKPLLAFTIDAAKKSGLIDRVIVSTDDSDISKVALDYGAEILFTRPANISQDNTPDLPVIRHLINWLAENEDLKFDLLVHLRPTSPFKTAKIIDNAIELLLKNELLTSVRSVTRSEGVFHPYWMFKNEVGILKPFISNVDITKYYQRQLLPECYRLNGLVDVLRTNVISQSDNYFGDKIGFLVTEEMQSIDIDTEFDFELCEFILGKRQ